MEPVGAGALAEDGGRGPVGTAAVAQLGACLGCISAGHLFQCLVPLALGGFELGFQAVGGGAQVVTALARRFGEGRVGKMRRVLDPGAVLLGLDLAVEIGGHVLELADHVLEIGNLACFLVGLKLFQPQS